MLALLRPAHRLAEYPSVLTWAETRCEHRHVMVEGRVTLTEALPRGHTSWDGLKQLQTARESAASPALKENWKYGSDPTTGD